MTLRGSLGGFGNMPGYRELPKALRIELLDITMIWYSLLVDSDEDKGLRSEIGEQMQSLKRAIDAYSERNFVYLIATRPRVRIAGKPRYKLLSGDLVIPLSIGRDGTRARAIIPAACLRALGFAHRAAVRHTGKKLVFDGFPPIWIHTLLMTLNIDFGLNTEITYVGRTEAPGTRVIDGNHRGLADTLTLALETQDDVFVFSCMFHGRHHASTEDHSVSFIISNSLTDQVDLASETDLIEKLLIHHFDPVTQRASRKTDVAILRNTLTKLRNEQQIENVTMAFEVDDPSEYFKFGNPAVAYAHRHAFTCRLVDGGVHETSLAESGVDASVA
jgi:hypothetical protein